MPQYIELRKKYNIPENHTFCIAKIKEIDRATYNEEIYEIKEYDGDILVATYIKTERFDCSGSSCSYIKK